MQKNEELIFGPETEVLFDFLTGKAIKDTPEERVRQAFIETLVNDYLYPKEFIKREIPIQSGSKVLLDKDGSQIRADIVVYKSVSAALKCVDCH